MQRNVNRLSCRETARVTSALLGQPNFPRTINGLKLPVKQRITYKIALLTFNTINRENPSYLFDLLKINPTSNRRSSIKNLLKVPLIKSQNGRRSFTFSAPAVWNSLPQGIRDCRSEVSFRKKLKTFLFPVQWCCHFGLVFWFLGGLCFLLWFFRLTLYP